MLEKNKNTSLNDIQKQEAIDRMHMLHIHPECIKAYEKGEVWQSQEPLGMLYELTGEQKESITAFEEKYNATVYHDIHGNYEFYGGDIMSFDTYLYVSAHPEEWQEDQELLSEGRPYAYVENLQESYLSEIGMVGIAPANGGLTRNDYGYDFASMDLSVEELADKLDSFSEAYDPYSYRDEFDTRQEGYEQTLKGLLEGQTEEIKDYLQDIIKNDDDPDMVSQAKDLLKNLENFEEKGISEDLHQEKGLGMGM